MPTRATTGAFRAHSPVRARSRRRTDRGNRPDTTATFAGPNAGPNHTDRHVARVAVTLPPALGRYCRSPVNQARSVATSTTGRGSSGPASVVAS